MTIVTKSIRFDAAHILANHQGLCRNLHGHTYHVDISVAQTASPAATSPSAAEDGMVIDFKDLKAVANDVICSRFDHAFIYSHASDAERDIAAVVERHGMRTVPLPFRTTAENLAKYFFGELEPRLKGLVAVKVWETPDNAAEFRP